MCDAEIKTYEQLNQNDRKKIHEYVVNLIKFNEDCINYRNDNGETILMLAIRFGDFNTVLTLLQRKNVVVNIRNLEGLTVFDYVMNKYIDMFIYNYKYKDILDKITNIIINKSSDKVVKNGLDRIINELATNDRLGARTSRIYSMVFIHVANLMEKTYKKHLLREYCNEFIKPIRETLDEGVVV